MAAQRHPSDIIPVEPLGDPGYRLMVEHVTDLVVKITPAGHYLFVSPSYCRLFGKRADEMLGRRFLPLVHEDDRESTTTAMQALWQEPWSCYLEQRALTAQGWRWLAWQDTAIRDESGQVFAIVGIGRDITDRRRLEDRLAHSRRLEAVGRLAGGIAHDFNNLLAPILGYTELMLPKAVGRDRERLGHIRSAAQRGKSLVQQLTAFSRCQVVALRTVDLAGVVVGFEALLRDLLPVSVELLLDLQQGLRVKADVMQLERVVLNLVMNARDAMPHGGRLTVRVKPAASPEGKDEVELAVIDSGEGIDPAVIGRVFEPFFSTKGSGKGLGLGLATVQGIVEQHEGRISIKSAPDQGTQVVVRLAAVDSEPDSGSSTMLRILSGQGRILVVEDEDVIREMVDEALSQSGYVVVTASSGAEALALLGGSQTFDLLLTDVQMPGMDGVELGRRARSLISDLRVLFMSGYARDGLGLERAMASHGFLAKPFTIAQLTSAVGAALV